VLFSAYKVSHPLLDYSKPFMLIKTNGTKSPRKALSDANERLKADVQELQKMI
jgi:DNA-directed RNA polymerase subunit L